MPSLTLVHLYHDLYRSDNDVRFPHIFISFTLLCFCGPCFAEFKLELLFPASILGTANLSAFKTFYVKKLSY